MNINDRLRLVRESFGESQAKYAIRFGLPQSTYAQYEKGGRSIPDELKMQLAQIGVNIHWLVTGQGGMYLNEALSEQECPTDGQDGMMVSETAPRYGIPSKIQTPKGEVVVSPDDEMLYIPITEQKLSAGPGQDWGDDSFTGERVPVLKRLVKRYGPRRLLASPVVGDSMEPTISDGDIAIYAKEFVYGDGIYALSVQGDVLIKRVSFDKFANRLTIISDNNKYPNRDIPASADGVMVLGKVISWVHVEV